MRNWPRNRTRRKSQGFPFVWEGTDRRARACSGRAAPAAKPTCAPTCAGRACRVTKVKKQPHALRPAKIKPKDIAVFTRQLATMLTAGIPLVQAFEIVGNGHDKPQCRS